MGVSFETDEDNISVKQKPSLAEGTRDCHLEGIPEQNIRCKEDDY
jgi:hypothetical protein